MALSAKMLALIQKIEAADEVHFAGLREDVKKEAKARAQSLEKKRANLRVARAVQKAQNERRARSGVKKKPKG
jgi:hypothetical protein